MGLGNKKNICQAPIPRVGVMQFAVLSNTRPAFQYRSIKEQVDRKLRKLNHSNVFLKYRFGKKLDIPLVSAPKMICFKKEYADF